MDNYNRCPGRELLCSKNLTLVSTRIVIIFLFLQLVGHPSFSQPSRIAPDRQHISEMERTKGYEKDTAYIELLVDCAIAYYSVDLDSLLFYARKAYDLAGKTHYMKWEAKSLRAIGDYYEAKGDYIRMLPYLQQALSLSQTAGTKRVTADILSDLGQFHLQTTEYEKARAEFNKAYELARETGNTRMVADYLTSIADTYSAQGDLDRALLDYKQALQMVESTPVEDQLYFIMNYKASIGLLLGRQGQYGAALTYLTPTLCYYRDNKDKFGIILTTFGLARIYHGLGQPSLARTYALESLSWAKAMRYEDDIADASRLLSTLYEKEGDYRQSLSYFKLYKTTSDSLTNESVRKKTFELEATYDFEKKEAALKIEHAKEIALQDSRLKSMRMEISLCALATVFLSILVVVLYRSRIVKEQNNRQLMAKNLEIAEQNKRIELQAADLRHNNSQKDQLFSIIAHDLRGPLNSLKSLLDLLKKRSLSEIEIAKTINSLKNNVDNSADLVNNLLYWARSQMKGIEAAPVILQAEPLAAAALNLFAIQAAEKNICLENKLDNDFTVYADKDMLQLVFRNTISNAIKFCRPGDRITIEGGAMVADLAEICVIDTGTGIKEEVLEKLNNRKSVTTTGTSAELGTGLGLMLCQEFVEKNGGHFRLQSTWGKGTRICFALPVRPPRTNAI
jgi:two-component system sensor histidine kinase/response regulator